MRLSWKTGSSAGWGGSSANVRFTLPSDAIPTLNGSIVQKIQPGVAWEVRASLDVTRARDMRQSQEITVLKSLSTEDVPARPIVAEAAHRQCALALDLSRRSARSGDTLDGSLRAEMIDDVEAEEIRVELVRVEKFGNESQDHIVDKATFKREASLKSSETGMWRFHLDVGQVKTPSLQAEKSSVAWLVKGILDRRMRRDLRVEQEINVGF